MVTKFVIHFLSHMNLLLQYVILSPTYNHRLAQNHFSDVIMGMMASQITSLRIVYSSVYSGADQRKHQSSASLAFVRGIHLWPVNSPHKGSVTRKIIPFDDVIMCVDASFVVSSWTDVMDLIKYSTTICKLVDLIPALHQSDCRIPNWVSAKTVLSLRD